MPLVRAQNKLFLLARTSNIQKTKFQAIELQNIQYIDKNPQITWNYITETQIVQYRYN